MIYSLAVMLIIASLDSVRSGNLFHLVQKPLIVNPWVSESLTLSRPFLILNKFLFSDNKWYTVEDEWGTHYPIDSDPDNSAAYYSIKIKTKTDDNESKVIAMAYLNTAGYKSGRIKIDVGLNKVWIDFCQKVSEQLPDQLQSFILAFATL